MMNLIGRRINMLDPNIKYCSGYTELENLGEYLSENGTFLPPISSTLPPCLPARKHPEMRSGAVEKAALRKIVSIYESPLCP